jgi:hypothetical protein
MKILATIFVVFGSLWSAPAQSNSPADAATHAVIISSVYIDSLMAEGRTNNPSVKAADARVRSATLNAEAVRTWEDPMAMVGGSAFSARGFDPAQEGDLN